VIGAREVRDQTVAIRSRDGQEVLPEGDAIAAIVERVRAGG
jgi:hypothetical protein